MKENAYRSGCPECRHKGGCTKCRHREPRGKLEVYDWLKDIPGENDSHTVEVMFKNTRNGFFTNPLNLPLKPDDIVVVEANPGHDIGRIILTGPLVDKQMKKAGITPDRELKQVLRFATRQDLDIFDEARAREHSTMIKARAIAEDLGLSMKIGDVEYQGDGTKAIFYYIADERVDFRKLIRVLADTFKIRVEMKQIGARQEAGRIGGIGPCGRPLCCSTWLNKFVSVGTGAARLQDLSMNPQKLAGQCAKLKCCLNYEIDSYAEASRKLPPKDLTLETADATYYYFKPDILSRKISYSTDRHAPVNVVTIDADRAFEVWDMNKKGIKPEALDKEENRQKQKGYADIIDQDSVTRFDKKKKKKKSKSGNKVKNKPADKTD